MPEESAPKDLVGFFDYYLVRKAPFHLPPAVKEFIVRFGPWITVVLLVLALPPLLLVLGIGAVFVPFGGVGYAATFGLATVFLIVEIGLMVVALPGLFARRMAGWTLLFYSQLVSIVYALLTGSIVGGIIGGLIGLYILFQIRPLYTR